MHDASTHIVLHVADNVATALRNLAAGTAVAPAGDAGGGPPITLAEDIAFGHKFALAAIAAGADVVKYGESIGVASQPIAAGAHVHVHNLDSRRARP